MSAILSADDLNDFISPGVACIKPVETKKTIDPTHARIEISIEGVPTETLETGQSTTLEKAQISLSDCLACSGCITSAESVLVSLQSHEELLSSLRSASHKTFVASISHQVRVSLAGAYGISVEQVDAKLQNLLVDTLGFKYVVGLEVGRVISLSESFREVSTKSIGKPILCSSCPGWTCYAEKTHPHIIPHLSHVKSPQQITGSLIKDMIHKETGIAKDNIYHLSIMPCFDKKLEAARPEFGQEESDNSFGYRDVDCVITAKEIVLLLMNEGISFESLKDTRESMAPSPALWPANEQWLSHVGSSSGGYLDYILSAVQHRIDAPTQIQTINGKNSDIVELRVVSEDNQIHFRAARIYGFRNIQNLVRKLKPTGKKPGGNAAVRAKVIARASARGTGRRRAGAATEEAGELLSDPSLLDYVEVMACPGGCLNGGGQIGVPEGKTQKEWKQQLESLYQAMPQINAANWTEFVEEKANHWTTQLLEDPSQLAVEYHAIDDILNPSSQSSAAAVAATPLALGAKW